MIFLNNFKVINHGQKNQWWDLDVETQELAPSFERWHGQRHHDFDSPAQIEETWNSTPPPQHSSLLSIAFPEKLNNTVNQD